MAPTLDERIEALLNQLDARSLTQAEIDKIQKKIDYLSSLK